MGVLVATAITACRQVEDSHALLHRYKKEIEELKKQLSMYVPPDTMFPQSHLPCGCILPSSPSALRMHFVYIGCYFRHRYQQSQKDAPQAPRTSAEMLVEAKDKEQLQKIIKQLTDMILDSEKLSGEKSPGADDPDGTGAESEGGSAAGKQRSRGRRGSGTLVGGGTLLGDSLLEPHTPSPAQGSSKHSAQDGPPSTASRRRNSLATSKHEMRDIKAALELLMERTALSPTHGAQRGHDFATSPHAEPGPLPPPSNNRDSALQAEIKQLKRELKDKESVLQECYGLIDTAVQNQEDLTKQHEEIMAENEKLRGEVEELRSIAEAANAALVALDENEALKKELRRFKKICMSRERELLELKGVSPEAESF